MTYVKSIVYSNLTGATPFQNARNTSTGRNRNTFRTGLVLCKLKGPKNKILILFREKIKYPCTSRITYLQWLKETYRQLPRFLKERGVDFKKTLHYPPGFFAPGGFLSANLLPKYTPIAFIT
jgi:hypothetical protein